MIEPQVREQIPLPPLENNAVIKKTHQNLKFHQMLSNIHNFGKSSIMLDAQLFSEFEEEGVPLFGVDPPTFLFVEALTRPSVVQFDLEGFHDVKFVGGLFVGFAGHLGEYFWLVPVDVPIGAMFLCTVRPDLFHSRFRM